MKQELAAYEIRHLINELDLNGAKVEKIYQPDKREIIIELHVRGEGKKFLRMTDKFFYLASSKGIVPEKPSGFCVFLRKHLENSRIKEISQRNFERIVEIVFEEKQGVHNGHRLVIELFGKGNIILCDNDYVILMPLEIQKWERCEVRPKQKYVFPKQKYDFSNITAGAFKEMIKETEKESAVKMLAIDLGLGGMYSEEICAIAGINKYKSPKELHGKEIILIFGAIETLKKMKSNPKIILKNGEISDVVPVDLSIYKNNDNKKFSTYNEALDEVLKKKSSEAKKQQIKSKLDKEIEKIENIISIQKKHLAATIKDSDENKLKGEMIYQNYELVSEVIRELKKAREKYSWQEIKEKLKGHKIIKNIDEKTGSIAIEI